MGKIKLPSRRRFLRSVAEMGVPLAAGALFPKIARGVSLSAATSPAADAFSTPLKPGSPFGVTLVDVAAGAGLRDVCVFGNNITKRWIIETTGCGIAFFDYDHDGWPDIFMVNGTTLAGFPKDQGPTNHLYHNNRDGTFTDITRKAGLRRTGWGQGVCIGDYDNDGWDDLFITYWGQNALYHNNGDGTFTDVTERAGLHQPDALPRWNTGACFIDYDRDGHLDLFIANYVALNLKETPAMGSGKYCHWKGVPVMCGPRGLPSATNLLYHNNGDATFTEVTAKSGILKTPGHYAFTALTGDFDNDGWPDIYVACDSTPSILYHNNHDGTFTDIGIAAGCGLSGDGDVQAGMGATAGDYNCDGWLDIFKTNFSDDTSSLYFNDEHGSFSDATYDAGIGLNTRWLGWGCGFVDLDNDGWADIFLANGHVYPEVERAGIDEPFKEPKIVYRNLRNGRFEDVSSRAGPGVSLRRAARGVAFGDFDNDGGIDIVVNNMNDAPTLLRNRGGNRQRWLKVKVLGVKSNRSGIGARVRVVAGSHSQTDEVRSGGSYISQNELRLHFGLGPMEKADLVEVKWPSGAVDLVKNIEADQVIWIKEGAGIVKNEGYGKK
ncbi:MAG: CRTAC1 family protein [Terriglobia bacterium]